MSAQPGLVHVVRPAQRQTPVAAALLRATNALWAAADLDALVAAAQALLGDIAPGTTVARRHPGDTRGAAALAKGRPLQVRLGGDEVLAISTPGGRDQRDVLQAAVESIAARAEALAQQAKLAGSVQQLGRSERLQRALYAIADQAGAAGTDLTPMFEVLHAIVGSLMYAENFYIALYDARIDRVWFPYFADSVDPAPTFPQTDVPSGGQLPEPSWPMAEIAHGPTWYVIHDGKPLMGAIDTMRKQVNGPFKAAGAVCEDYLGVPLLRGQDVVGCVAVQSYDKTHHYDEQDKALLIYVAQHIQTALERRLAHAELERRVEERTLALSQANAVLHREVQERQRGERLQAALFRIAELASTTDRIDTFYESVHLVVGRLLNARNFYIALLSADGTELSFPYRVDEHDASPVMRKLGTGMTEYLLRRGTAVLADRAELERLRASGEVTQYGTDSACWLGVPLICDDHVVGALVVQSYDAEQAYTRRDEELLTFVSYHIANALQRIRAAESLKQAYAQLETRIGERTRALALANRNLRAQVSERERAESRLRYEALHDSLTGLPNRNLLMQRLAQALRDHHADPAHGFAVMFMDLDRFKVINDSMGHLAGDALLVQVGERIRARLKTGDVVARLGGDEFCVLLDGVSDGADACRIAERIINDLNAPFRLADKELFTSTSIGITLAAPNYQEPAELLRDADSAMYRAKAGGRHRCVLFDEILRREAVSELEVESDLRRGITRFEFVPYYQPVVDIEAGRVVGYEALMRWRHPQRGVLLPGAFLGVAEDTGTSETIDWQIFAQVCRDANALIGDDAFIAINLSAQHFNNPRFDQRLLGLLAEYAVPPSRLHVEVTERALLENTPAVKRILQVFRSAGISISLDDFGTGYSSLSYLHQYPLQTLKIDQSFVAHLDADADTGSDAVIRAILAMAETLSIRVIAEGVETALQRDRLRKLGCRYVQGFLYASAQPIDAWIDGRGDRPAADTCGSAVAVPSTATQALESTHPQ